MYPEIQGFVTVGAVMMLLAAASVVFLLGRWLVKMFSDEGPEAAAHDRVKMHVERYIAILSGAAQIGDARFADDGEIEKNFSGGGILLGCGAKGDLTYNGDQHLLLSAMARAGKFVNFIAPNLLHLDDRSIIVIDPKGQAAAVTARRRREMGHKVIFINPFEMHTGEPWKLQGSGFNPLAALNPENFDFVDRTMSITEALIQDSGKDSHWSESARDILAAIIMHEIVKRGFTTLGNVRGILTMPEDERKSYVDAMTTCDFDEVRELAGRFLAQNNEISGIFSEAITQTRFLTSPLVKNCLDGDDFRFEQLKNEKITVYIIIPARYLKSQSRFLRLMVVSAIDAMMASEKKQGDNSVLFMIDEFPALGYLSSVENAMGLAAGYGLQLWPIVQDFNQLRAIYGDKWETFLGNTGVKIIKGANDNFTAEYISKMVGERSVPSETANMGEGSNTYLGKGEDDAGSRSESFNGGVGVSSIKRPLFPMHELRGEWFNKNHLLIKSGLAFPVAAAGEPYYLPSAAGWSRFSGKYDPDPYHMPKEGGGSVNNNQQDEQQEQPPEPEKPKQVSLNDRMRQAARKGV